MYQKKIIFNLTLIVLILSFAGIILSMKADVVKENPSVVVNNSVEPQPEELGKVKWLRNYEDALTMSNKSDKPVLILFQEVPGCATCRNYGNNALSHPLIVEAIETLFVPLAIYNNIKGADAKVLAEFGEPSWNNPVVRVINADKRELTPRLGGDYSPLGLVKAMTNALTVNGSVVPMYLQLLQEELISNSIGVEEATFGMYCFWSGEKELGSMTGVVSTQPGFMDGREVVTVAYNPEIITFETILSEAKKAKCASHVFANDDRQFAKAKKLVHSDQISEAGKFRLDKEPKYYLSKTDYQYVPMTALQATKANALIGKQQSPNAVLSPRQVELAQFIAQHKNLAWKNAINQPFEKAWEAVMLLR